MKVSTRKCDRSNTTTAGGLHAKESYTLNHTRAQTNKTATEKQPCFSKGMLEMEMAQSKEPDKYKVSKLRFNTMITKQKVQRCHVHFLYIFVHKWATTKMCTCFLVVALVLKQGKKQKKEKGKKENIDEKNLLSFAIITKLRFIFTKSTERAQERLNLKTLQITTPKL